MKQPDFKLSWNLLILKILASHPDGEASTTAIARDLAILISVKRDSQPIEGGIFSTGYVVSPSKGTWRITDQGRAYLGSLNSEPNDGEI
jgi:hypothetical protein